MDTERTSGELDRAEEQFGEIVQLHIAARRSIILAATVPGAAAMLQAQIAMERLKHGVGMDTIDDAENVLTTVRQELEDNFVRLRRATLVAMCSAFEYLVKAAYVDQASANPVEAGRLLDSVNVRLRASEVVGLDRTERWYLVADRLYDYLGEQTSLQSRGVGDRARRLLTEFVASDDERKKGIQSVFSGSQLEKLNEAFLVRNCFVHNGGRVNAALSRVSRKTYGEVLVLDREYGPALMQAVISVKKALEELRFRL